MKLIRQGSKGPEVRAIQYFLAGEGYYKAIVDGDFGPITHRAVVAYQRARALKPDGIIGNITLGAMLADGLVLMPSADSAPAGAFPPGFPPRPSFSPLSSNAARARVFGSFSFVPAPTPSNPEAIRITDDWAARNIVEVVIPQLAALGIHGTGRQWCHRLVRDQMLGLWQAWDDAGLLKHVRSWHGLYVPRFVRGSRTTLSNHSFGTAFDVNLTGNMLGHTPAAVGTANSVRELVPIAHRFGFYWGGHFSRADGMHFEVAIVK